MERALINVDDMFDRLGIGTLARQGKYRGVCPVHGGKSHNFTFYTGGYKSPGFWNCQSEHCERVFRGNVIGLVRGVLSREEKGWSARGDETVTWGRAVQWLCDWMGVNFDDLKPDPERIARKKLIDDMEQLTKSRKTSGGICDRETLRSHLEIPARYYINHLYSPALLNAYDVGFCRNRKSSLYNRVVVPIYDDDYKYVVGCIGRSLHQKCESCRHYHYAIDPCPSPIEYARFAKWRVSDGFIDKHWLYNYWFAKEAIASSRSVVIVEGAGDVWRLVSCGVKNVVGVMGSDLSESQFLTLETSQATSIVCLSDNDQAGENLYEQIKRKCWFASSIIRPEFEGHDIGELAEGYIHENLVPIINSKLRRK